MHWRLLLPLLVFCLVACTATPTGVSDSGSGVPAQGDQRQAESGSQGADQRSEASYTDDDPKTTALPDSPKATAFPDAPKATVIGEPTPVPPAVHTPAPQPTYAPTSTPLVPDIPSPALPGPSEPAGTDDIDAWLAQLTASFGSYEALRSEIGRLTQVATVQALTGAAGATLDQLNGLTTDLEQLSAKVAAYPVPTELAVLQQMLLDLSRETGVALTAIVEALSAQNVGQEGAGIQVQEAVAALWRLDGLIDAFKAELGKFD